MIQEYGLRNARAQCFDVLFERPMYMMMQNQIYAPMTAGDSSTAGKALRTACKLNLGSCYLNTGAI